MRKIATILLIYCAYQVTCYNILCVYPTLYRSHFITPQALLVGLAKKGHNVSVVSPYPLNKPLANYHDFTVPLNQTNLKDFSKIMMETAGNRAKGLKIYNVVLNLILTEAHAYMIHPLMQKIMQENRFDVIILESINGFQLVGLGEHFKCPIVFISSHMTVQISRFISRTPFQVSTVPSEMTDFMQPMNFFERVINAVVSIASYIGFFEYLPIIEKFYDEHFPPPKYPKFMEAVNRISLFLTNSHYSESLVQAYLPHTIQIGGIHLTEGGESLDKNLRDWMDESTEGVILMGMGSVLSCTHLTPEILDAFITVFRHLKQNVLWNCDDQRISQLVTPNVRLETWSPQTGVLAHPNTILFITHCGFGSYIESIYYGVPVLAIPMVMDQLFNARRIVFHKIGIEIQYLNINKKSLAYALQQLLNNSTYSERATYMSQLYKDRPISALDTGVYWVEYVVRHKGAEHLKLKPTLISIFEFLSLDVMALFIVVFLIVIYAIRQIIRKVLAFILSKSKMKAE